MVNIEAWCNVKNPCRVPIGQVVSNPKYRREEIMSRSRSDAPPRPALDWPTKTKTPRKNFNLLFLMSFQRSSDKISDAFAPLDQGGLRSDGKVMVGMAVRTSRCPLATTTIRAPPRIATRSKAISASRTRPSRPHHVSSASTRAAQMKSFSERPPMAWVL